MVQTAAVSDQGIRDQLIQQGICQPDHPAIRVELFGTLRVRSGQSYVPMHANTIRTAMSALMRSHPGIARLLPPLDQLSDSHRFSINGKTVTTDLDTPLREGDTLLLFSATVGG